MDHFYRNHRSMKRISKNPDDQRNETFSCKAMDRRGYIKLTIFGGVFKQKTIIFQDKHVATLR